MSTTALWTVDAAVPDRAEPIRQPSFFQRLIRAREIEASRRIHSFLAAQPDSHLQDLGYTADEIADLRRGQLALPRR